MTIQKYYPPEKVGKDQETLYSQVFKLLDGSGSFLVIQKQFYDTNEGRYIPFVVIPGRLQRNRLERDICVNEIETITDPTLRTNLVKTVEHQTLRVL